jgi:hypothetical protein
MTFLLMSRTEHRPVWPRYVIDSHAAPEISLDGNKKTCGRARSASRIFSIALISALSLSPIISRAADKFEILNESTVEGLNLCKMISKNIGRLPQNTDLNYWPSHLQFPNLEQADWTSLEPLSYLNVIKTEYVKFSDLAYDAPESEKDAYWNKIKDDIISKIKSKTIMIDQSHFDINGDGRNTIIFRITKPVTSFGTIGKIKFGKLKYAGWAYVIHSSEIDPEVHDASFFASRLLNWYGFIYKGRSWFIENKGQYADLTRFYINAIHNIRFAAECMFSFSTKGEEK